MLTNLYVDNYMCSSLCPCIAYSNLDPSKWGNNATVLKNNYDFTGSYKSFYQCYLDLNEQGLIQTISSATLDYIAANEDNESCGGICDTLPMFYFNKEITEGPPPNSCKDKVKKDI